MKTENGIRKTLGVIGLGAIGALVANYACPPDCGTPAEMEAIFSDIPEALENTMEIADKVEVYSINSDPIMPVFDIPESFGSEAEYRSRISEKELFDEFTQNEKHEVVLSQADAEKKIKKLGGYNKLTDLT